MSSNGTASPTADRVFYTDDSNMYLRIPGRDSTRGEITHKRWRDMNRKERRIMLSGKRPTLRV